MKRKIVMFGAVMAASIGFMAMPAVKSYANTGYTPGSGLIEGKMQSKKSIQGSADILIDSDDFKIIAQALDTLYEQLPEDNKNAFKTNMGW